MAAASSSNSSSTARRRVRSRGSGRDSMNSRIGSCGGQSSAERMTPKSRIPGIVSVPSKSKRTPRSRKGRVWRDSCVTWYRRLRSIPRSVGTLGGSYLPPGRHDPSAGRGHRSTGPGDFERPRPVSRSQSFGGPPSAASSPSSRNTYMSSFAKKRLSCTETGKYTESDVS